MGSEERQELEANIDELEDKVNMVVMIMYMYIILQVNEKFFELKGTYRDCRKSTGNKFEYWYT